jgi:LPS sulfotransferase NodH
MSILKQRNYKVIYLERKNVVRQVLSGVIANKRKKFNAKNYVSDGQSYDLDLAKFKTLIQGELSAVVFQKKMVKAHGFDSLLINYEDFLNDRDAFFQKLFAFLGVENMLPENSSFSIMIPSVKDVVKNFNEFSECMDEMGLRECIEN